MSPPRTARPVAVAVTVLGASVFVALAWWRVPWHPVPGGPVTPVSVGSVFSPAEVARADAFVRPARLLSWASIAVSLVVASVLGFTPLRFRLTRRLRGWWWVRVVVVSGGVLLIGTVATLPLALLLRSRLLRFGLTHQSLAGWARDQVTTLVLTWLATAVVLVVIVGCARRWTRAWPAVAGVSLAGFVLLASFAYPVVVEPLFNHFTPLPAGQLRTQILKLADIEHVHIGDVLVADASRRTTTLNAYVSGYGDTRRVVLYDTTLDSLSQPEILSVVAHELGHARRDDVLTGSLIGAAGTLAAIGLLGLLVPVGTERRRFTTGRRTPRVSTGATSSGRRDIGDGSVVPLVLALATWGMFLASPIQNTISRQIETRADVAALEATHDPAAFVGLQRQLALRSLADPTPPAWAQLWFGSHPTSLQRVAVARHLAGQR